MQWSLRVNDNRTAAFGFRPYLLDLNNWGSATTYTVQHLKAHDRVRLYAEHSFEKMEETGWHYNQYNVVLLCDSCTA